MMVNKMSKPKTKRINSVQTISRHETDSKKASNALTPTEKAKIVDRILSDVQEYYQTFSKPCPSKAMSAKYSRALRGEYYEVIAELESKGFIIVELLEHTAARVFYPGKKLK